MRRTGRFVLAPHGIQYRQRQRKTHPSIQAKYHMMFSFFIAQV
jgi:hypothetical protein